MHTKKKRSEVKNTHKGKQHRTHGTKMALQKKQKKNTLFIDQTYVKTNKNATIEHNPNTHTHTHASTHKHRKNKTYCRWYVINHSFLIYDFTLL